MPQIAWRTVGGIALLAASCRGTSGTVLYEVYQVQKDDTLQSIAARFGITVEELVAANKFLEAEGLPPHQKLTVQTYEVQKGDTLRSIATRFGLTLDQLLAANPSLKSEALKSHPFLMVPVPREKLPTRIASPQPPEAPPPKVSSGWPSTAPSAYLEQGRTMVPLRALLEWLGVQVHFDQGRIIASKGRELLQLRVGSPEAEVNGKPVTLEIPVAIRENLTFVPLRFVSESFGAYVQWKPQDSGVLLVYGSRRVTVPLERPTLAAPPSSPPGGEQPSGLAPLP
jgi:LysM repeat protein